MIMGSYKSFASGVEVGGKGIIAFIEGMGMYKLVGTSMLASHGISDPSPGVWYSLQSWLGAFAEKRGKLGSDSIHAVGRRLLHLHGVVEGYSRNGPPGRAVIDGSRHEGRHASTSGRCRGHRGFSCLAITRPARRAVLLAIGLVVCLGCQWAQDDGGKLSRTITRIGAAFTAGDDLRPDNLGYGAKSQTFTFFDPEKPSGFYYGFAGADAFHTAGGVSIMDTRLVTLGWRMEADGAPFAFDCGISPVFGSRSVGNRLFGSFYVGVQPLIGLVFMVNGKIDIELAYEPVIGLFMLFGSEDVRNRAYHDISLSILIKNLSRIQARAW
jgi:hypothetical protein